ncbi:MAG: hypothetical protein N2746_09065 [Deltaproteobacteria bacterium]|nr:hypothetical protein [Deltaproteobacteria bacterium]
MSLSVTQTILLREYLCFVQGSELSLGILLSLWLFFNSLGALLIGILKEFDSKKGIYFLPVVGVISSLISLLFLRYARVIFGLEIGLLPDIKMMVVSSIISLFFPALISGLSFPYLSSILKRQQGELSIAYVYATESLGLVFGYLLMLFLLLFGVPHIPILILSYSFPFVWLILTGVNRVRSAFLLFFIALLVGVGSYMDRTLLKSSFELQNKGYKFIDAKETNYNRYVVSERNHQYTLFVNNHFSKLLIDDYSSKVVAHLVMSLIDVKERVLIIGEASYDLLRHFEEYKSLIDYVEYDKELLKFLKGYYGLEEGVFKNIKFVLDDGRRYVRNIHKKYDIIFVDLSEPLSLQINRYYTDEFFAEVKSILSSNGVFVFSLPSISFAPSKPKSDYLSSVFYALKDNFSHISVLDYEKTFFVASQSPIDINLEKVVKRFKSDIGSNCNFEPEIMSLALQEESNKRVRNTLEVRERIINTDLKPRAMLSALALWEMSVDEAGESITLLVAEYSLYVFFMTLGLAFFISFLLRKVRYIYSSTIMFWQGFLSMAIEIIVIYRFQIESGTLYYHISFLFSLFMLGLSVGSYLVGKIRIKPHQIIVGNLIILALLYLPTISNSVLFLVLLFNGVVTGLVFGSLSLYLVRFETNPLQRSASIIDFSDCLGGMVAAPITSLVLIPVIGVPYCIGTLCIIQILTMIYSIINVKK